MFQFPTGFAWLVGTTWLAACFDLFERQFAQPHSLRLKDGCVARVSSTAAASFKPRRVTAHLWRFSFFSQSEGEMHAKREERKQIRFQCC